MKFKESANGLLTDSQWAGPVQSNTSDVTIMKLKDNNTTITSPNSVIIRKSKIKLLTN